MEESESWQTVASIYQHLHVGVTWLDTSTLPMDISIGHPFEALGISIITLGVKDYKKNDL